MPDFLQELAKKIQVNIQFCNLDDFKDGKAEEISGKVKEKITELSFTDGSISASKNINKELLIIKLSETIPAIEKVYDEWLKEYQYRVLSVPWLTPESFEDGGAISEDPEAIEWRLNKMENELNKAEGFHITSAYGTDLTVGLRSLKERRWAKETGILEKGQWGNLPVGEIYTTPDEKNVNGVLMLPVMDSYVSPNQGVDEFIKVTVRDGVIVSIEGGESSKQFREYLEKQMQSDVDDKNNPWNTRRIAEIAFGANSKARSMALDESKPYSTKGASTVEGEKRLGTIHLAFGDSKHGEEGVEGFETSHSHLDFVIPRNGLSVEMFQAEEDVKSRKNDSR